MNCTKCNTPGAPHELIDGLCHECTAKLKNEWCLKYTELAELYSKTADELQRLKAKDNEMCEWKKSTTAFIYYSACHEGIVLAANDFTYCPYCGKRIKLI